MTYLDKAYGARTAEQTQALYDEWAATYDAEVEGNGYATPRRCAEALSRHCAADVPVLDMGCGTGLSGVALRAAGFATVHGADPAAEMLRQAEATGAYATLTHSDPHDPFAGAPDVPAISCCGVIGVGAAPLTLFDQAMDHLPADGLLVLSLNGHALERPEFPAKIDEWRRRGTLLFEELGDHLPGIGLRSRVYVIAK